MEPTLASPTRAKKLTFDVELQNERPPETPPGDARGPGSARRPVDGETPARTLSREAASRAVKNKQKWWHVPDERIEELIQSLDQPREAPSPDLAEGRASPPIPAGWLAGLRRGQVPSQSELLKLQALQGAFVHQGPSQEKLWHVPDAQIRDMVTDMARATPSGESSSALARTGSNVLRSGRNSRASHSRSRGDGKICVQIYIAECGDTLCLRVPPETRVGPPKQPPRNRFTDLFGPEDSISLRLSADGSSLLQVTPDLGGPSLKELIANFTSVEPARQKLAFRKVPMSNDGLAVQAYGIKDRDTVHLSVQRTGGGSRNRPASVTEAAASLRENAALREQRGSGDAWLIPRWVSQDNPRLFGRTSAMTLGGSQNDGVKFRNDFGDQPIYLPDQRESSMARVRVTVTGSSTYV